jgi:hypothetical protein
VAEYRPDLLVEGIRRDPRREDCGDRDCDEEQGRTHRDALVTERPQHEATAALAGFGRSLDE